uniref:Uncharacterized protein n=1 Tax=Romanomermis culicivorax TaxID=13658 RepID=A0A915KV19_ROMCU
MGWAKYELKKWFGQTGGARSHFSGPCKSLIRLYGTDPISCSIR